MRSRDLADRASITVRTLRHYHQIGLLEEPARSSNGYRDYNTYALVRVLRIRRLVELGFSLPQISTMLEGDDPPPSALFDALDEEYATQIENLTRQRELLSHLRRYEALPDLPPEIASFHNLLRHSGLTGRAAAVDRDHTLLLMHLIGSQGQGYLTAIYELLSHPHRASAAAAAMTAWADLDEESSREEMMTLADQITELFLPVLAELATQDLPEFPPPPEAWFRMHTTNYLSSAQRTVLDKVRSDLDDRNDESSTSEYP
ncbi:MerR family transcriptional regulator [Nesterenkonia xinjiangensis]|uniref:DNA-binding transcriptional MerR regulator n=1 Tax=Nesterenkonia xinjiangensis TaxID=225327 RepID=A0A7Z0GNQ2_9MICC|nr:MerR family transcriptional regulator [Nesterenkonia xinjiangensis]NYJ79346.1 DNA-binding transcriptional MerR regulator [Nesterenkonia xinjiangensis]